MKKVLLILSAFTLAFSSRKTVPFSVPLKQIESVRDGAGRLNLIALGTEGRVYCSRQADNNGSMSGFIRIENYIDSKADYGPGTNNQPKVFFKFLTAKKDDDGSITIYGIENNGVLYYSYRYRDRIDAWSAWIKIGTDFKQVAALKNDNSNLVFGLRTDGSISYEYLKDTISRITKVKYKIGSGWKPLYGSNLFQITCEKSGKDHVIVFALSFDGSVYANWANTSTPSQWSNWTSLGGSGLKKIEVSRNTDGRLILFAIGGDDYTYERHQFAPGPGGGWSEWATIPDGQNIKDISSCMNSVSQVHFFALHTDGSVDVKWQLTAGGDAWSGWLPFGGPQIQSIKCDRTENGRGVLFAIGGDGQAYYRWQVVPNGDWSQWQILSN